FPYWYLDQVPPTVTVRKGRFCTGRSELFSPFFLSVVAQRVTHAAVGRRGWVRGRATHRPPPSASLDDRDDAGDQGSEKRGWSRDGRRATSSTTTGSAGAQVRGGSRNVTVRASASRRAGTPIGQVRT